MSDLITGTQLQRDDLTGQNIIRELDNVGQWARTLKFDTLTEEIKKCTHKDRELKLTPIFIELGYEIRLFKYQILRVVSRGYIDAGAPAYLIPIRIEETAAGTVYDATTRPVKLAVGQRVYFKDPIIIEPGIDFLLITAR